MAIGAKRLWKLRCGDGSNGDEQQLATGRPGILAVAAVTIANGGDNTSVYTPLLATRSGADLTVIQMAYDILTALWCMFAHWLVNQRIISSPVRRDRHASFRSSESPSVS